MLTARAALDRADREGRPRTFGHLHVRNLGAREAHRVNGARALGEVRPGVAARARDGEAVAVAADGGVEKTPHVGIVDGEEPVDVVRAVEEVLGAADVAVAFLAHGAHEPDVALGFDACFLKGADRLKKAAKPAAVVGDARAPSSGRLRGAP